MVNCNIVVQKNSVDENSCKIFHPTRARWKCALDPETLFNVNLFVVLLQLNHSIIFIQRSSKFRGKNYDRTCFCRSDLREVASRRSLQLFRM